MQEEILQRLRNVVSEKLGVSPDILCFGAVLSDIGIDSYALIELVFSIEEELKIRIPLDGIAVKTVDDVVLIVEAELRKQSSFALPQA
jgi:acyl carrier protein